MYSRATLVGVARLGAPHTEELFVPMKEVDLHTYVHTYIHTYSTICAPTLPYFRVCANHSGQPRRVGQACKNTGIQRTMETHNPVLVCVTYMLKIHISVSHTQNEHM